MPTDPLALRHGKLIAEGWRVINAARAAVKRDDPPGGQLARLQSIQHRIAAAREAEIALQAYPPEDIIYWFSQIETVLQKAEAHFINQVQYAKAA